MFLFEFYKKSIHLFVLRFSLELVTLSLYLPPISLYTYIYFYPLVLAGQNEFACALAYGRECP